MKKLPKEKWVEILFYVFILAVWIAWAWIMPFNEGPDEYMRSRIVEYIVEYGKLPTGYQQEIMDYSWGFTYAFRPILPQILEAGFVRVGMLFTSDAFSLLFVGRLSSILCGLVFVGYVRAAAKKLFDGSHIQWLFTLLVVCLPQAAFLFTYLNCDSMALMATAMIFWYLLKGMEDSFSIPTCLKLAVSFSICVLSYYNAYGFLITGALVFSGFYLEKNRLEKGRDGQNGQSCWKEFWAKGFLILGVVLLLSGWWFVRNYFLYDGDILGLRTQNEYAEHYAMDILKPSNRQTYQNRGYSMFYMLFRSDFVLSVAKSFIGVLGPLWYALRWWMYAGYGLIFGAGFLGLAAEAVLRFRSKRQIRNSGFQSSTVQNRENRKGRSRIHGHLNCMRLSWHLGLIIAILVPNILNFWYSYATDYQPQGRYSMPMLIPFMYYITRGLYFLMKGIGERAGTLIRRLLEVGTVLVCLWIAGCALFCVVKIMWPAYKDVEDKSQVKVYTMEELYGEDWEERIGQ